MFASIRRKISAIKDSDPQLLDLVAMYLFVKVAFLLVALLRGQLLPFDWPDYGATLVLDIQEDILVPFNTWDTQNYLLLSKQGYGVNPMSNAFYPLYPYLIRIFTPLFFNKGIIAAYAVANLISLLVPVYMYKLTHLFATKEQAFRAAVLLLSFPTAFFMSVAYSESLYLSLCLMVFYYLFTGDMKKASLFCFLLPLARAQGLLLIVPIGILFLQAFFSQKGDAGVNRMHAAGALLLPALSTLLGMGAYFVFCRWQLGGFLAGLEAQKLYVANNSLGNLLSPFHWFLDNFINIHLQLHGYTNSLIDRAAFLLCLPMLFGIYRTQNRAIFAYAALTMLVPAMAGTFMSYTRYLLVVFPLFIYLGIRFPKSMYYLAPPMFALQVLFYLMHTGGYWVA